MAHDMINPLHDNQTTRRSLKPKEGEQRLLCSNNVAVGSPSLGFNKDEESAEDLLLERLAEILVEYYFEQRKLSQQKSGNLL
jgi:hypothetical protein